MPLLPNSVPQADTLVAPLIAQLTLVAQQIQGIGNCYAVVPDAPPENGSVVFAPKGIKVDDDSTNAQLVLHIEIDLLHVFTRKRLQQNLQEVLSALPAWLNVLTAWPNETLGGLAQNFDVKSIDIAPYTHGQQPYLALVSKLDIRTIQNITLS